MKIPLYLMLKPLSYAINVLPIDKQVSFILTLIRNNVNIDKKTENSLKFLFKLDRGIYSLIGRESIRYGGGIHTKHRHIKYHEFFIKNISEGEYILDIGCGNGYLAFDIVTQVENVKITGIDLNRRNIDFAKKYYRHPDLKFMVRDALKNLPTEKFDVVILSNVLEHLKYRVKFLTQIREKISPAKYLIRVPLFERDWRVPLMKELGLDYRLDPTHYIEYSEEDFLYELKKAQLKSKYHQVRWGEIWAKVVAD